MKKLPISYLDLELCLEDHTRDINQYYLDTETGEVITIDQSLYSQWEDGEEIEKEDLPPWQQDQFDSMMAVFNDVNEQRLKMVPEFDAIDEADTMRLFVRKVENRAITNELFDALDGPKSFRRFRAMLNRHPAVRSQYDQFQEQEYQVFLENWLQEIGIEPEWSDNA